MAAPRVFAYAPIYARNIAPSLRKIKLRLGRAVSSDGRGLRLPWEGAHRGALRVHRKMGKIRVEK